MDADDEGVFDFGENSDLVISCGVDEFFLFEVRLWFFECILLVGVDIFN
jgi:hypothetical protein